MIRILVADDPVVSGVEKFGFISVLIKPYTIYELGNVLHDLIV